MGRPIGFTPAAAMLAYVGSAKCFSILLTAEERTTAREPGSTLRRALVSGVATVVGVYLSVNATYAHVVSFDVLAHSRLLAAGIMRGVVGPAGTTFVSALVVLSPFGTRDGENVVAPPALLRDGMRPAAESAGNLRSSPL